MKWLSILKPQKAISSKLKISIEFRLFKNFQNLRKHLKPINIALWDSAVYITCEYEFLRWKLGWRFTAGIKYGVGVQLVGPGRGNWQIRKIDPLETDFLSNPEFVWAELILAKRYDTNASFKVRTSFWLYHWIEKNSPKVSLGQSFVRKLSKCSESLKIDQNNF